MKQIKIIGVVSQAEKPETYQTINASGLTFPVVKQVPVYRKQQNILYLVDTIEEGKIVKGLMITVVLAPNIKSSFLSIGKKHFIPAVAVKPYTESKPLDNEKIIAETEKSKEVPTVLNVAVTKPNFFQQGKETYEEIKADANSHFPVMLGAGAGLGLGFLISKSVPVPRFLTVIALGVLGVYAGKKYYDYEKLAKGAAEKTTESTGATEKTADAEMGVGQGLPLADITAKIETIKLSNGKKMSDEEKKQFADFYTSISEEERKIASDIATAMCASTKVAVLRRKKFILFVFDKLKSAYGSEKMEALKDKMEKAKLQF